MLGQLRKSLCEIFWYNWPDSLFWTDVVCESGTRSAQKKFTFSFCILNYYWYLANTKFIKFTKMIIATYTLIIPLNWNYFTRSSTYSASWASTCLILLCYFLVWVIIRSYDFVLTLIRRRWCWQYLRYHGYVQPSLASQQIQDVESMLV